MSFAHHSGLVNVSCLPLFDPRRTGDTVNLSDLSGAAICVSEQSIEHIAGQLQDTTINPCLLPFYG
jgi:hypothetical protein